MGMFDKDKLYGGTPLDQWIEPNVEFILYGAKVVTEEFPLEEQGKFATKCEYYVATMEDPDTIVKVSSLSGAMADKVKEAEPSDFPAVVVFKEVPSGQAGFGNAKVLQFSRGYDGEAPSFDPEQVPDANVGTEGAPAKVA